MLLLIILSIGAVYAFIPIVIIIILILAARGSAGRGFFDMFGISTLFTAVTGIGGGGAGKGLSSGKAAKYQASAKGKKTAGAVKGVNAGIANIVKKNAAAENAVLQGMSIAELHKLIENYGLGIKAKGLVTKDDLIKFALANLSLTQVNKFYTNAIAPLRPQGAPPPLQSPSARGTAQGFASRANSVRMSIGNFYKAYYGARRGVVNRTQSDQVRNLLATMSTAQLYELSNRSGLAVTPTMSRDDLQKLIASGIPLAQIKSYVRSSKGGTKNIFRSNPTMPSGSGKIAPPPSAAAGPKAGGAPDPKLDMLEQMSGPELQDMIKYFGRSAGTESSKDNLVGFAYGNLTPQQIKEYFDKIRGTSS
jgi:hypothetical protein